MNTNANFYITTAIPYVNAEPHLGHALELVQADVLARHRRLRGQPVRFLTGTDDNALKNVAAARAAGVDVCTFVEANAARFLGLRCPIDLSFDDFIRTSAEARHRAGVEQLWRQCAERGDFYRRRYEGLYCPGCEQFYTAEELNEGLCPEHRVAPDLVAEDNWFFRLSRYTDAVREALETDRVRVEPATRRNEVLAFVRSGLRDFSVSRPTARAEGWGIPVPGDPEQVVYVWWDALSNYITALGYGGEDEVAYRAWWVDAAERVHVIGKGITRFHAVYWLALLLSAGLPLPTAIYVHEYLSVNGAKISKSAGNAISPYVLAERYGPDPLRWWLLREVARQGDTDFTVERLLRRTNGELSNGIGNLQNRTLTLLVKHRDGHVPQPGRRRSVGADLVNATDALPAEVDGALGRFDFRAATEAIWRVVELANRLVNAEKPWELARSETAGDATASARLDEVLAVLVDALRVTATELQPFIPTGAKALLRQLHGPRIGQPTPVFPRHQESPAL